MYSPLFSLKITSNCSIISYAKFEKGRIPTFRAFMKYYLYGISDAGDFRENNEDCFLINNIVKTDTSFECVCEAPFLTAVCDGVSGTSFGEIASDMALSELSRISYCSSIDLFREIMLIDKKMKRYGRNNPQALNMQTTLCCVGIDENDRVISANIGDSRLYLYSGGAIFQITTDQSLVHMLKSAGRMTFDDVSSSVIFPVLGNNEHSANPDIVSVRHCFSESDIMLLCTDGLSDFLTEEELEIGLSLELPLSERIDTLVELALERGSTDNITAVAVCVIEE